MTTAAEVPPPWSGLPAELAPALRARLAATSPLMTRAVAAVPAFAGIENPKFQRDLQRAVRVALDRFVELAGTGEAALPPPVRQVFVDLGAAEAREDRGPDALLAAVRAASRVLLRAAVAALADVRPIGADEILDLSDAVAGYGDELAAATTDGFALQVREQAGEGDRLRRRLAEILVRGGASAAAARSAAAAVGWRELDAVVPVVLPPEQARQVRFRYGTDGVVTERADEAVLLLRDGPRVARAQLAEALHGCGAVVAPAAGWPRVPQGVRLAELTARLVGLADRRVRDGEAVEVVFVEDHLAALALNGEPEALAVLAGRRLAALAGLRDAERERLLGTLHSWLRHWGSRADVASELFVHPQTVSYRMRRLRQLLGEDLDDPAARFELMLVLAGPVRGASVGTPHHSGPSGRNKPIGLA